MTTLWLIQPAQRSRCDKSGSQWLRAFALQGAGQNIATNRYPERGLDFRLPHSTAEYASPAKRYR
jgi:hypothetical protein